MALTNADRDRRIAAATSEDTIRGVAFDAVFRLVSQHAGEDAARACDPLGTAQRVYFRRYPAADFLRLAYAAARELSRSHGGADGALEAMGAPVWAEVAKGMLGRTIVSLAGDDPRRLLDQIDAGYHAVVSYGVRTVSWRGEREATVRFERELLPAAFHRGVVAAAISSVGAAGVRVGGGDVRFLELSLEASWS